MCSYYKDQNKINVLQIILEKFKNKASLMIRDFALDSHSVHCVPSLHYTCQTNNRKQRGMYREPGIAQTAHHTDFLLPLESHFQGLSAGLLGLSQPAQGTLILEMAWSTWLAVTSEHAAGN